MRQELRRVLRVDLVRSQKVAGQREAPDVVELRREGRDAVEILLELRVEVGEHLITAPDLPSPAVARELDGEVVGARARRRDDLGGNFDYINVVGVLHHLPDPQAGLGILVDKLTPRGGMAMMVYASVGRTGVYHVRAMSRIVAQARQLGAGGGADVLGESCEEIKHDGAA